jgi:hypothetical protein
MLQGERNWDLTGGEKIPADASDEVRTGTPDFHQ